MKNKSNTAQLLVFLLITVLVLSLSTTSLASDFGSEKELSPSDIENLIIEDTLKVDKKLIIQV